MFRNAVTSIKNLIPLRRDESTREFFSEAKSIRRGLKDHKKKQNQVRRAGMPEMPEDLMSQYDKFVEKCLGKDIYVKALSPKMQREFDRINQEFGDVLDAHESLLRRQDNDGPVKSVYDEEHHSEHEFHTTLPKPKPLPQREEKTQEQIAQEQELRSRQTRSM